MHWRGRRPAGADELTPQERLGGAVARRRGRVLSLRRTGGFAYNDGRGGPSVTAAVFAAFPLSAEPGARTDVARVSRARQLQMCAAQGREPSHQPLAEYVSRWITVPLRPLPVFSSPAPNLRACARQRAGVGVSARACVQVRLRACVEQGGDDGGVTRVSLCRLVTRQLVRNGLARGVEHLPQCARAPCRQLGHMCARTCSGARLCAQAGVHVACCNNVRCTLPVARCGWRARACLDEVPVSVSVFAREERRRNARLACQ